MPDPGEAFFIKVIINLQVYQLSTGQKAKLARVIQFYPIRYLLALIVRLTVARHRTGVVLVGYDEEGRILLLKHVFHPTAPWGLPGGWLEKGESPAACAKRELREETGLSAELGPIIYHSKESAPGHIGLAFIAKINNGDMILSSEIIEAKWFAQSELPGKLLPFVSNAISAGNNFFSTWKMMGQGTYE